MNSGFRPLPASMPVLERARIMHRRGEARSFEEAMSMLRAHKRAIKKIAAEPEARQHRPDVRIRQYKDD